jgi:hypothetical protein
VSAGLRARATDRARPGDRRGWVVSEQIAGARREFQHWSNQANPCGRHRLASRVRVGRDRRRFARLARPFGVVIGKTRSGYEPFGDTGPSHLDGSCGTSSHSVKPVDGSRGDFEGRRRSCSLGCGESNNAKRSINSIGRGQSVTSTGAGAANQPRSFEKRVRGEHFTLLTGLLSDRKTAGARSRIQSPSLAGTQSRIGNPDGTHCTARYQTGRCTVESTSDRGCAVAH